MKRITITIDEAKLETLKDYIGDKRPSEIIDQALQEMIWRQAGDTFLNTLRKEHIELWPDYADTYRQDHTDEEWGELGWGARKPMMVADLPDDPDRGRKR
jgi:hypothetical protein